MAAPEEWLVETNPQDHQLSKHAFLVATVKGKVTNTEHKALKNPNGVVGHYTTVLLFMFVKVQTLQQ